MSTLLAIVFSLLAAVPANAQRRRPDTLAARLDRDLTAFLKARAAADQFSGVVMVADHGVPIFARAYGDADHRARRPNSIATRFNLGSADKMFTAVAVAHLINEGRVALDTPFGHYVADYPNHAVAQRVTIRELLAHTSGLGNYFNAAFLAHHDGINTVADLIPFFANDTLQFAPGSRFGYSNAGYVVLGLVIEHVSGETYYDYVAHHIFQPAGMNNAGFPFLDSLGDRRDYAIGYTQPPGPDGRPQPGPRVENTQVIPGVRGSPAGGGYATAGDLIAFSRALWSGQLVPLDMVRELTRGMNPIGPMAPAVRYGLGFGEMRLGGHRIVGHNGGGPGINAEFDMYPDLGYDVVVLSNYDPPSATAVIMKVREMLTGVVLPSPRRPGP